MKKQPTNAWTRRILPCLTFLLLFCCQGLHAQTEDEYLQFLYKYMPLPDSTDYSEAFWRETVEYALKARKEMGWNVPEREWKHFVLPLRVNNEDLDGARKVFYDALKDRVKGLSMYDAILEVNHWCHEQVTYQPSDARTSSPLATMRNGIGRCGEESTFAVTALRAVGIPARQVYTPRWAHTDDNHAWVEAWADGKWYFLGACEPEPVLNLGWFNAPASRGMLMHTKVFGGDYDGTETVIYRNKCYTEIDVTDHYAPTAKFVVRTLDANGRPVSANIDYRLYNYAEFFTLVKHKSNEQGIDNFRAGLGDLLIWASRGDDYGYAKCSVGKQDTVTVILNNPKEEADIDITPPVERNTIPPLTAEQIARNKQRLAQEDSIRNSHPHGNQAVLDAFETSATDKALARKLLSLISEKDRRDVTIDVLTDSYLYSKCDSPLVLNPRVLNEMLTPYKAILGSQLPKLSPAEWAKWVRDSIRIDDSRNPNFQNMHPVSVWRHRVTDRWSWNIFFVAGARALGYEAEMDPVTYIPYVIDRSSGSPVKIGLTDDDEVLDDNKGILHIECNEPLSYYSHFTISRIIEGRPYLLSYPEEGVTVANFQREKLTEGDYMMVNGTRLASGGVLSHIRFFHINRGDSLSLTLNMRHDDEQLQVIGNLNAEDIYTSREGTKQSILSTTGRGYYVLGLVRDGHEPSNHAIHDINLKKEDIDAVGRPMLVISAEDNPAIVDELVNSLHLATSELPIFVIADTFNRVVWYRQGYTIGLGEQLLKALKKL